MSREAIRRRLFCGLICGFMVATQGVLPSVSQAQDKVPLKELLLNRDPLLRKLFAKSPDDDVKGLAAKIKADEITVKHRIKAIRYLATVDCVAYPEAKEMLVKMLHKDKWEPVRYEAAQALKIMLAAGKCSEQRDPERFGGWLSAWKKNNRRASKTSYQSRQDYCPCLLYTSPSPRD